MFVPSGGTPCASQYGLTHVLTLCNTLPSLSKRQRTATPQRNRPAPAAPASATAPTHATAFHVQSADVQKALEDLFVAVQADDADTAQRMETYGQRIAELEKEREHLKNGNGVSLPIGSVNFMRVVGLARAGQLST